jgi:hypothetical protein
LRSVLQMVDVDVADVLQAFGDPKRADGPEQLRSLVRECSGSSIEQRPRERHISFQRVTLLLLHIVTKPAVSNTTLKHYLLTIIAILEEQSLIDNIMACMRELRKKHGVWPTPTEPGFQAEDADWAATNWPDVGVTVVDFFMLLLTRTQHVPSDAFVAFISRDLFEWVPLCGSTFKHKLEHMKKIVDRYVQPAPQPAPPLPPVVQPAARAAAATIEGPGELRPTGPRHDNDFADFMRISTVPTQLEVLCPVVPYLPQNSAEAKHHLGGVSWLRHVDTHYRLLRHDMIASLADGLTAFARGDYRSWESKTSGQRFYVKGGSSDLFVYTGARKQSSIRFLYMLTPRRYRKYSFPKGRASKWPCIQSSLQSAHKRWVKET